MLCGDLNGKEVQKGGDICIHIADLLCCNVETNTYCKVTILKLKKSFKGHVSFEETWLRPSSALPEQKLIFTAPSLIPALPGMRQHSICQ